MKKLLSLLLILSVMMGLNGCFGAVLKSPPEMIVTCGDVCISVVSDDYTWTGPGKGWKKETVITCAFNSLDIFIVDPKTWNIHEVSYETVSLSFPVKPDEITIQRIQLPASGDYEKVTYSENLTFQLEEGEWFYLITAFWDRNRWSGEASYRFTVSK